MYEYLYERVQEAVINNKIYKAIEDIGYILSNYRLEKDYPQFAILKSRYNELENSMHNGIISREDYLLEINKIKFSLLQLPNELIKRLPSYEKVARTVEKGSVIELKKLPYKNKINLIFKKVTTDERFELETSKYINLGELARQILISFEPNYEENFLFKEGRVNIIVIKVAKNGKETLLDIRKSIVENNLQNNNTISIKFELKNESFIEFRPRRGGRLV